MPPFVETLASTGQGRAEAAKVLGLADVPIIRLPHLTAAKKRAFAIADNKLALNSTWDLENLKLELGDLDGLDLEFDLVITGFETAEIDLILDGDTRQVKEDPADRVPEPEKVAVTRPGDLWELSAHRIICGDAPKPESFDTLMGEDQARLVFVDPPYNVPIGGVVPGLIQSRAASAAPMFAAISALAAEMRWSKRESGGNVSASAYLAVSTARTVESSASMRVRSSFA